MDAHGHRILPAPLAGEDVERDGAIVGLAGLAEPFEPDAPGMHTTDTIDYAVVLDARSRSSSTCRPATASARSAGSPCCS
jgi:hypothetical protein